MTSGAASAATDPTSRLPVAGELVAGRYRLVRALGQGGIGAVFAAVDVSTGGTVALKLLLPALAFDADVRARFVREASATARVRHPNVVRVLDVGATEAGAPFLVMEYLEGRDLGALLEAHGPLQATSAVRLLLQACDGLAAAHALGIVHRDVKSANLFLTSGAGGGPWIKVVDFGLAKSLAGTLDERAKSLTNTAASFGTPTHMAPEQVRSSKHVDARADVWAMGVVAYELLTGRLPFDGPSVGAVLAAVIADAPAPLPASVPPALAAIVLRCLEKDPRRRFASMADLAAALVPYAPADMIAARGDSSSAITQRPGARAGSSALRTVALAGVGLIAGALVVVAVAARGGAPSPAPPATSSAQPAASSTAAAAPPTSASAATLPAPASAPPIESAPRVEGTSRPDPSASSISPPRQAPRRPDPTLDRE